ncbi:MAG: lipocalin family protein [Rhodoferax sp.]|nr:lipocalin family protein [Rhodoferax sp.]
MHIKTLGWIGLALWSVGGSAAAAEPPALQPIASLDLARYVGTWYEVAKYPNRFQSDCVRNVQAQYVVLADGAVQVRNRCNTASGQPIEAVGSARQMGPADSPRLKVRFAPAWLSFLPSVWGDYWVVDLDPHYQLAVVSEPRREYLWVLSRTPHVDADVYRSVLGRLNEMGFEVPRLQLTPQD